MPKDRRIKFQVSSEHSIQRKNARVPSARKNPFVARDRIFIQDLDDLIRSRFYISWVGNPGGGMSSRLFERRDSRYNRPATASVRFHHRPAKPFVEGRKKKEGGIPIQFRKAGIGNSWEKVDAIHSRFEGWPDHDQIRTVTSKAFPDRTINEQYPGAVLVPGVASHMENILFLNPDWNRTDPARQRSF